MAPREALNPAQQRGFSFRLVPSAFAQRQPSSEYKADALGEPSAIHTRPFSFGKQSGSKNSDQFWLYFDAGRTIRLRECLAFSRNAAIATSPGSAMNTISASAKFLRPKRFAAPFFALLLLTAASNSHSQTSRISEKDFADAKRTILSVNADWITAMRARDPRRATLAYAKDAVFVARDGRVLSGHDEIEKATAERMAQGTTLIDGALLDDGLQVVGALVYEWGHSSLKWKTANGQFQSTSGQFLTIWKQTSDAHWEIIRNLTL